MKAWKAIVAALVIFAAGVVTGGLTVRLNRADATPTPAPASTNLGPLRFRSDLLERMQRQLYLTPVQRERVEVILRDNHEHMRKLWESIAPQAQSEYRRANDLIRAELTADQQQRFDELQKSRGATRAFEDRRRREDRREPKPSSRK